MKEKLKYLYLDDIDKDMRNGLVEFLNKSSSRIQITTEYPPSWRQRSAQLMADLDKIDGLILDWELTNNSAKAKEGAINAEDIDYSAESLAEHIRISSAQQGKGDIPIIICSADKNKAFTTFRIREKTSQDLFDLSLVKDDLFVNKVDIYEPQLYDLALLYKNLIDPSVVNVETVLGLKKQALENLDIRFVDRLQTMLKTNTTHDIVQFLLKEFMGKEGILINEDILAARLGLDKQKSDKDWQKIKDILEAEEVKYRGFLSIGWLNYWAFELEFWWQKYFEGTELRILGAKERIARLNEKFKLNLVVAEPIKFCSSEQFRYIFLGASPNLRTRIINI